MITGRGRRLVRTVPWLGLAVVLFLLFLGVMGLVRQQREHLLADAQDHAHDDVALLEAFVHEALQRYDYQLIDGLLKQWGEKRRKVLAIRVSAANGFVLGRFERDQPGAETYRLSRRIPYSYKGIATLEMTTSLNAVAVGLARIRAQLGIGVVAIGSVLGILIWLGLRLRSEADVLRVRSAELDQANLRLRNAAQELRRMRSYLKNIVDSMPSILVGVDRKGCVTEWNRSAELSTGVRAGDAMGQRFETLFPELESQLEKVSEAVRTQEPVQTERLVTERDGKSHYSDVMVYPLMTNGVDGVVIRVDDVTTRVRIEQMMVQTEKMMSVGGLAAGMAHEINNPLSGVLQSAQNIQRRLSSELAANRQAAESLGLTVEQVRAYLDERDILRFVEGIQEAASRGARIVADMLAFSRRTGNEFVPARAEDMLEAVLRLAGSDYDLRKRYDFKRMEVVREYDPSLGPIDCDATEIEQVLLNLVKNAAHALVDGGSPPYRITLRTIRDGDFARIEVEDNGPGMDEATRRRVFEPFFTTKETGLGTGLGLSVSYFIVTDQHQGMMSVSAPGKAGACFVVRLPRHGRRPR